MAGDGRRARAARAATALGVLAAGIGVYQAVRLAWTADDAYISFRYAQNLVNGLGLFYNAGERVEGYSNFLWTLWCAAGLRLGISPESWANAWGIAFFAGTIALLAALTVRRAQAGRAFAVVPIAALAVALHHDACVFATGGLETSFFTFLVLLGYVVLARVGTEPVYRPNGAEAAPGRRDARYAAAGALVLGLASLTRPDGAVFAAIGAIYVPWAARRRLGATLAYVAVLAAIGVPYAAWKLAYYGDLLPNTFYAKSAGVAWWDQGLVYLGLYARRYSVLIAAPLVAVSIAVVRARREARTGTVAARPAPVEVGPLFLAAAFAIAYTLAVVRLGGDFMFARLLIPATPFYALTLEYAIASLDSDARGAAALPATAAAASLCVVAFSPEPVRGDAMVRGVANEREFYMSQRYTDRKAIGEDLRELTRGLPVRVVISGTSAIVGYYSQAPVLIEASAGLTDRRTARLTLQSRGRVGHEKSAPLRYLIEDRRAHLQVGSSRQFDDSVSAYVPPIRLSYKSLHATLLTWDPPIMDEFRRRGAQFPEFLPGLDRFLEGMDRVPDRVVAAAYDQTKRFYFSAARDSARESAFIRRLAHPQPAPALTVPRTGS